MKESRPTRACGLKRFPRSRVNLLLSVTPHTGVWIETVMPHSRH